MSAAIPIFRPRAAAILAAFLLAGCGLTPEGDLARDFVKTEGAQAYDEGLANGEWFVCRAASVGSVQRRYGAAPELAAAWRTLCLGDPETGAVFAAPAP
jgi:hypothetical protein